MKISVSVQVEKEMHELGEAVAGLVLKIKEKAADGLSVTDVVAAVGEEMTSLVQGVVGLEQLPAEAKEDLEAFSAAVALPMCKILGGLAGKPAEAVAVPSV